MADLYALIADEDEVFRDRLSVLLSENGIELAVAEGDEDLLSLLQRLRPAVVVLAVELPGKAGFTSFSKVKKAQRNVPVVIVTSTVSRTDMKMHEKLRAHAEIYLEKAELPDEELLGAIARAAALELSLPEPAEDNATTAVAVATPMPAVAGPIEAPEQESPDVSENASAMLHPRLLELLDPETAAILAEIDEGPSGSARPIGEASQERIEELEEDVDRLETELRHARVDAQHSPFASEFVTIREEDGRKDREISTASRALARRNAQIRVVKRRLTELATRLVAAGTDRDEARQVAEELDSRVESIQEKLDQSTERAAASKNEHMEEVRALKERLSRARADHAKVCEERSELESVLERVRAKVEKMTSDSETSKTRHGREIAAAKAELLMQQERHQNATQEYRKVHANALEDLGNRLREKLSEKHDAQLMEIEQAHARTLDGLRQEHARELDSLHRTQKETVEHAAAEAREASKRNAAALEQAEEQRFAELARAEEKRLADCHALETRLDAKIASANEKHRAERQKLGQKVAAEAQSNDSAAEELNARVQDVVESLRKERTLHNETREKNKRLLAALHAKLKKEHAETMRKLNKEKKQALLSLEQAHRSMAARQDKAAQGTLRAVEAERDEARVSAEALRAELADVAAKNRSSSTVTEEQHDTKIIELENDFESRLSQLENEKRILSASIDKAKRELASELKRTEDALAREKEKHQSTRERSEKRVAELEARHTEGIERVEKDWMEKLKNLEKR